MCNQLISVAYFGSSTYQLPLKSTVFKKASTASSVFFSYILVGDKPIYAAASTPHTGTII